MRPSSRLKLTTTVFLLLFLIVGLALFGSTRLATHAAGTHLSSSQKPRASSITSAFSCGVWNTVSSPNASTGNNILYGVASVNANNSWVVGTYHNGTADVNQTLVEHWNGTNWNVVSSPNIGTGENVLLGIARVPNSSQLWAVGYYLNSSTGNDKTLIEEWDGGNWNVVSSPNPATNNNVVNSVVALSTSNVWAVGYGTNPQGDRQTLVEHWDGASWNVISSSNPSSYYNVFNGVARVPNTNQLWAVGYEGNSNGDLQTLIEHWNGTSWKLVSSQNPGLSYNLLYGITAISTSNVWAVGYIYDNSNGFSQTLIEHWNGTNWSVVPSANPAASINRLLAIAAISANNIWVVGYETNTNIYQTLIEHWNGTSWNVVPSPSPDPNSNFLYGIARVPGTSHLWTVGYDSNYPTEQTLIEFYC